MDEIYFAVRELGFEGVIDRLVTVYSVPPLPPSDGLTRDAAGVLVIAYTLLHS